MILHDVNVKHESTTCEEPTLLGDYEVTKSSQDAHLDSGTGDRGTEWFPDSSNWGIDSLKNGRSYDKISSKWGVSKMGKFDEYINKELNNKIYKGQKIWNGRSKGRRDGYELGLALHHLVECANRAFGITNWMSEVGDSQIEGLEIMNTVDPNRQITVIDEEGNERIVTTDVEVTKYTMEVSTTITILLADGTCAEVRGHGYCENLPRDMAFRKCKKESITEGMKSAFGKLIVMLHEYHDKVRDGYYSKYT